MLSRSFAVCIRLASPLIVDPVVDVSRLLLSVEYFDAVQCTCEIADLIIRNLALLVAKLEAAFLKASNMIGLLCRSLSSECAL